MDRFGLNIMLFTIIFLEGYVVLSSELLAIRQTIPFVGSGTDTISIIIAAVLMPLAFGYHAGGQFKPGYHNGRYISIRAKLIQNLIISQVILVFGLSYFTLDFFFRELSVEGLSNTLLQLTIYCGVFLVTPVYLLGQTIPLVSNYFSKEDLSRTTGTMLFFSTVGSFMGAVFSTIVLMAFLGVHHTASINFIILALLITLLSKKSTRQKTYLSWSIAVIGLALNSGGMMSSMGIVENNQYNTIRIVETDNKRHMMLNNNLSSMMGAKGERSPYIEFIEREAILPIWRSDPPKDILVIGAGGFTLGYPDKNNHYDFIDIDPSLKDIAEEYLLQGKLGPNKYFHPVPARAFLSKTDKKYDLIVLDAYLGALTLPEHLATQDFFTHVKEFLKEDGVLMANFVVSANFNNAFSRNIDNTLRSVFPNVTRHTITNRPTLWSEETANNANAIYIYKHHGLESTGHIYTDNKNTIFLDKPKTRVDTKKKQQPESTPK